MMQHVQKHFVFSIVLSFFYALCFQQANNVFCLHRRRKSLADLFEAGKNFYLENDWQSCVTNFETAIKAYRVFNL